MTTALSGAAFDVAAIFQTFRERPAQPARLVGRLLAAAASARLTAQVLINDDSGEQPEAWQRALRAERRSRSLDRALGRLPASRPALHARPLFFTS